MIFNAQIQVMPLKELLDPQGKTVMNGLHHLGLHGVKEVRIGKLIDLEIEAGSELEAKTLAEEASARLLANPVMEYFTVAVR